MNFERNCYSIHIQDYKKFEGKQPNIPTMNTSNNKITNLEARGFGLGREMNWARDGKKVGSATQMSDHWVGRHPVRKTWATQTSIPAWKESHGQRSSHIGSAEMNCGEYCS